MKRVAFILLTVVVLSCKKHEKKLEGTWFVEYFVDDLKTEDFTLLFEEGGKGKLNGISDFSWSVNKKDLALTIAEVQRTWENNRNKKNVQFYIANDEEGRFLRMEMERIKE